MTVVVVAVATPAEGEEDAVEQAIRAAIPAVHTEDGCEKYALHRTHDGRDLVMIERWASWEALHAHREAAPFVQLVGALHGKLAAPLQVMRLDEIPAGTPELGRL